MHRCPGFLLLPLLAFVLAGCQSPPYVYHYIPGRTAIVRDGIAYAPPSAPEDVRVAIAAGNRIAGLPYRYGGGHTRAVDDAYDCSGAASFVLLSIGRLDEPTTAKALRDYGQGGQGEWISIYARRDHVFMVVAGLRFDTGWTRESKGPRWTTASRPTDGCVIRHPLGL
ncbi:MAG TPA: peptidoglycan endopeptidase [Chthoniobacteraceae bacterium]|nr:peptidoglycan endopeptidase [Chthoniobacteraceae bacterium]